MFQHVDEDSAGDEQEQEFPSRSNREPRGRSAAATTEDGGLFDLDGDVNAKEWKRYHDTFDEQARVVYPSLFLAFNLVYWLYYMYFVVSRY
jgi:hypothetical protein